MQIYLVGGAVRDKLLGQHVKDKDWVVVGATPQAMLDAGYRQVGADFPVFLHPQTQDEYALARTERKAGHGYHGFTCYAAPDVSLEDDLIRRDLTINAMAEDASGHIIDPYNGQQDLKLRKLRHVSDAFSEDPLRVLRVARFAARLAPLGFTVADETLTLMQDIATRGELAHLTAERVWQETARALLENEPAVYFRVLRACGALAVLFPELDALFGVPQPVEHHPEVDTGEHVLLALTYAAQQQHGLAIRFATLMHDLGKGLTPADLLPKHHGHENKGLPLVRALCERLKVPNDCRQLALLAAEYHTHIHRLPELTPKTVLKVLQACDVLRRPERVNDLLACCEADARGRTDKENDAYPQADLLKQYTQAVRQVSPQTLIEQGFTGKALGEALHKARLNAVRQIKEQA